MATTPSKQHRTRRCFSSPLSTQVSGEVRASSGSASDSPSLARYSKSVSLETHVALLQILNGPDEYATNKQIYDQNTLLFGKPNSTERAKVRGHRWYLEKLRKSNKEKFDGICATHGVAVRAEQQASGEPSAPSRSMSRNYRNRRK